MKGRFPVMVSSCVRFCSQLHLGLIATEPLSQCARVGALIPLFLSITATTLGIIACAMWGAVAHHGLNAGDPSVFHVHAGPSFVSGLLATRLWRCKRPP